MATHRTPTNGTALAALTVEITDRTGRAIQLLPAGHFAARDGRPASIAACKQWVCGPQQASTLVALAAQQANPMVIDYEHQTLNSQQNGQPAPAAGWFKNLEWRDGQGLFATDVDWTPAAAKAIADREYRYISPVFEFDPQSGAVQRLHMAALTNNPGLDGMQAVALSAFRFSTQEPQMNKLLQALLTALGLTEQTSEDQAVTALNAHLAKAKSDADQVTALTAEKANKDAQIAALTASAGTPDPAKYVPVAVVTGMQGQLAALTAQVVGREIDEIVGAALTAGQLLPAQETWARELGKSNLAALKNFVSTAPKIAALTGTQTGGQEPGAVASAASSTAGLSQTELAVCRQMGVDPTAYAKTKSAELAARQNGGA
ncbi:mu-like prophage I family protein [Burkholderia sp. MSHR3999]|uniref:phage protease n=1 Tax=Burkholderia sp. MSHR3999 TaxID=1542965 RepID=UPI0005AC4F64|nr:phage protease [Burkholderia sp. MSHR3999]KIP18108.1 mu-like prophage I family protein [Burkholderia sp. MSHR3999]